MSIASPHPRWPYISVQSLNLPTSFWLLSLSFSTTTKTHSLLGYSVHTKIQIQDVMLGPILFVTFLNHELKRSGKNILFGSNSFCFSFVTQKKPSRDRSHTFRCIIKRSVVYHHRTNWNNKRLSLEIDTYKYPKNAFPISLLFYLLAFAEANDGALYQ